MELSTAIALIQKGVDPGTSQRWADLGAGTGLFTRALSEIVGPGSVIYAVDKAAGQGPAIVTPKEITIEYIKADFTTSLAGVSHLDGILMANSLHFVADKISLLKKLSTYLEKNARFVIVEYDTDRANTWVPYPVSCKTLEKLVIENNIGTITKIGNAESKYQRGGMYGARITLPF